MHIPLWGASLTTPHVAVTSVDTASEATVVAAVEVANTGAAAADATVLVEVIKPDGEQPRYRWHLGCILLKMPTRYRC